MNECEDMINVRTSNDMGAFDANLETGVKIRYLRAGKGPLILLLHGFPETSHAWEKIIPKLSDSYTVVAPDLRGYGGSSRPAGVENYRSSVVAADVAALVRHLGFRELAAVVGHDWGGVIALRLERDFAETLVIRRLVLVSVAHPFVLEQAVRSDREQKRRSAYVRAFQIPDLPEKNLAKMGSSFFESCIRDKARQGSYTSADMDRYAALFPDPEAFRGPLNYYRAAATFGEDWAISRPIVTPMLVLFGDQDAYFTPGLTAGLAPLCKVAPEIIHYPEYGHWMLGEAHGEVAFRIAEFVSRDVDR